MNKNQESKTNDIYNQILSLKQLNETKIQWRIILKKWDIGITKKIVLRKITITIKICNIETFHEDIEYLSVTVYHFCIQSVRERYKTIVKIKT
jgi:hypothetical protein